MIPRVALAGLVLLAAITRVWASTNTYQEGATSCGNTNCGSAVPDAYIGDLGPDTNNDTGGWIVGPFIAVLRTLAQFDVSDIAGGSTITSASLAINVDGASGATAGTVCRVRRSDWSETQATWNSYKTSNSWSTAGAANTTNDIESPGSGNTACVGYTAPSGTGTFTISGLGGLVQDAIDNRSGILRVRVKQDSEATTFNEFSASDSENATVGNRPKLTVNYTAGGGASVMRRTLMGVGQ